MAAIASCSGFVGSVGDSSRCNKDGTNGPRLLAHFHQCLLLAFILRPFIDELKRLPGLGSSPNHCLSWPFPFIGGTPVLVM